MSRTSPDFVFWACENGRNEALEQSYLVNVREPHGGPLVRLTTFVGALGFALVGLQPTFAQVQGQLDERRRHAVRARTGC